MHRSSLSI